MTKELGTESESTDWKEKAYRAYVARWAEAEAQWKRDNPDKIKFYLIDPRTYSAKGQAHLQSVIDDLRANSIEVRASFMRLDSVDAVGGFTGEIAVLLKAVGPVLGGILGAWLQSKAGRKVRLKDGDLEVEARKVEEIRQLLDMAAEQRAKKEQKEGE